MLPIARGNEELRDVIPVPFGAQVVEVLGGIWQDQNVRCFVKALLTFVVPYLRMVATWMSGNSIRKICAIVSMGVFSVLVMGLVVVLLLRIFLVPLVQHPLLLLRQRLHIDGCRICSAIVAAG